MESLHEIVSPYKVPREEGVTSRRLFVYALPYIFRLIKFLCGLRISSFQGESDGDNYVMVIVMGKLDFISGIYLLLLSPLRALRNGG